ncbi:MAG: peptide-methionine (S)-S-oxide reductase [Helicobacteraceae bacterium CG2_30_36_10]|nr:MAG: peptide-methionine (S)-S-oxide reductase [Helicobacteraceae bacterium CG2_30_36_10]
MKKERLVLGGGCFWCTEAVYVNVKGVIAVVNAYAGGSRENPSYEQICTGATGHAEVIDITFDADVILRAELLEIFFAVHNPTTLNAQGADRGSQYRSVVYYNSDEEKEIIDKEILRAQKHYSEKIVTEVSPLPEVYPAEAYHQNYFYTNPSQGYCMAVIAPKLQKFMTKFPQNLDPK